MSRQTPSVASPASLAERPMRRVSGVHLVGIGGAGMAGIARVLLNLGYIVTGSDIRTGPETAALGVLGARIAIGHDADHVAAADVVVISSAVGDDNPEVIAAHARRIPVIPRAQMLAELMRFRYGIAVAGTHGKTTTTSILASILADGDLDPTFIVGGKVVSTDSNARLGAGPYLVAEADESDASFLFLTPVMAIITNIDADHLGTYDNDFDRLVEAFVQFIQHLPFYGLAVLCVDDPVVASIAERVSRPVMTYAVDADADLRGEHLSFDEHGSHFTLAYRDEPGTAVHLALPGRHNVANALAAAAVAHELGVSTATIAASLSGFAGIARRCENRGELLLAGKRVRLIDDYGHHPREIEAIVDAVTGAWPDRRVVVVFQPHRYTRTHDLFDAFCQVLAAIEHLAVCEIYAAGEPPIAGIDGAGLVAGVGRVRGRSPRYIGDLAELETILADWVVDGDVLLTLGAGDIGAAANRLVDSAAAGRVS